MFGSRAWQVSYLVLRTRKKSGRKLESPNFGESVSTLLSLRSKLDPLERVSLFCLRFAKTNATPPINWVIESAN